MIDAHVEAVTVLGGPCGVDEMFDFGRQDITKKIENVVPVMLKVSTCYAQGKYISYSR